MKKFIAAFILAFIWIVVPATSAFAAGTYNGNPIPEAPKGAVTFCQNGYCFVTGQAEAKQILDARKPPVVKKHRKHHHHR